MSAGLIVAIIAVLEFPPGNDENYYVMTLWVTYQGIIAFVPRFSFSNQVRTESRYGIKSDLLRFFPLDYKT